MNRSFILAGIIAATLVLWMTSRSWLPFADGEPDANGAADADAPSFTVRATTLTARDRKTNLSVRGRAEAVRVVDLRAEATGRVVALPAQEGALIGEGDVICQLDVRSREARLEEARASVRQMELEYKAARDLSGRGFRSETQTAAAAAALEQAKADLRERQIDLSNTRIKAPFPGRLDRYDVEIGDLMREGDSCAVIVDQDPFLVVAQVSELEVGAMAIGLPAQASLVTGETVSGDISYIGTRADPTTRTFRIEVTVPNPDQRVIRDGVTATLSVPKETVPAHRVPASLLTLNTAGAIGVRAIVEQDRVRFFPVTIVENEGDGVWVTGLPDPVTLITVGQEFVVDGERVRVEMDNAALTPTSAPIGPPLAPLLTSG